MLPINNLNVVDITPHSLSQSMIKPKIKTKI